MLLSVTCDEMVIGFRFIMFVAFCHPLTWLNEALYIKLKTITTKLRVRNYRQRTVSHMIIISGVFSIHVCCAF